MKVFGTLLTAVASFAAFITARPANGDFISEAHSVASHTSPIIFPTSSHAAVERAPGGDKHCTGIDPLHPPTTMSGIPTATRKRSLTTCNPFASPQSTTSRTSSPTTPVWRSYTTSISSNGWRSAPTSAPSAEDPIVEHVGWFKDIPDTPYPVKIEILLGVCQRADEGKGVPTWASFIDIKGAHWCEFYK